MKVANSCFRFGLQAQHNGEEEEEKEKEEKKAELLLDWFTTFAHSSNHEKALTSFYSTLSCWPQRRSHLLGLNSTWTNTRRPNSERDSNLFFLFLFHVRFHFCLLLAHSFSLAYTFTAYTSTTCAPALPLILMFCCHSGVLCEAKHWAGQLLSGFIWFQETD